MTGINLVDHFVETQPDYSQVKECFEEKKIITSLKTNVDSVLGKTDVHFLTSLFDSQPVNLDPVAGGKFITINSSQSDAYISEIKLDTTDKGNEEFSKVDNVIMDHNTSKHVHLFYKLADLTSVTEPTFSAISNLKVLEIDREFTDDKTFNSYQEMYPSLLSEYCLVSEKLYQENSGKKLYLIYEVTKFHADTLESVVKTFTFNSKIKCMLPSSQINEKLARSITPINNLITAFIAPYGLKFEKDILLKDSFILQNFLTDQSGQESYITTLVYYERFNWEEKNIHGVVQKTYSIISKVPAFKFFAEILYFIFNNPELRDGVLYPLYFTRLYTKNNTVLTFPCVNNSIKNEESEKVVPELVFESELSLPFVNHIDFSIIFSFVTLENICKLLTILLLEKSIVLTSYNENLLTPVIESLRTLMYPFEWQFSVIPMLEHTMEMLLDAPIPLLIGAKGNLDHIEDRVVFNIESGKFTNIDNNGGNDTELNLFESFMIELGEDLRLGGLYYNIETLKLAEIQNFSEVGCRTAFLRAFINMLGLSILDNFLFPSIEKEDDSKSGYFELSQLLDVKKYKKERQKNIKTFKPSKNWNFIFNDFLNTDCFYRFVYNCSFPKNEPLYFFTSDNYTNLFKFCSVKEKLGKRSYFQDIMSKESGFTTFDISSFEEELRLLRIPFDKSLSVEENSLNLDESTLKRLREYFEIRSNRKTKYLVFSKTSRNLISDIIEQKPRKDFRTSDDSKEKRKSLNNVIYYGTTYRPTEHVETDKLISDTLNYFKEEHQTLLKHLSDPQKVTDILKLRRDSTNIAVIIWLVIANTTRSMKIFKNAYENKDNTFDDFFNQFTGIFGRLKIAPSKVIMELFLGIVNSLNDPMYIAQTCGIMKKFNIPISKVFYKKNLSIARLSLTTKPVLEVIKKTHNFQEAEMEEKENCDDVVFKVGKLCKCGYYMDWFLLISHFVTEYYALVKCPNCHEEFIPYIDVIIGRKEMNILLFTPLLVLQTILEDVDIKEDILQLKKSIYSNNEENIFKRNKHKITNSKTLMDHNTQLYYNVAIYMLTFNLPLNVLSEMNFKMVEYRELKETNEDLEFMTKIEKALRLDNLEGALVLFLSMRRLNTGNTSIFHRNMLKTFVDMFNKLKGDEVLNDFKIEYYRKIKEIPPELRKYVFYDEEKEHYETIFFGEYFNQL